jgi:hypothetical protein
VNVYGPLVDGKIAQDRKRCGAFHKILLFGDCRETGCRGQ